MWTLRSGAVDAVTRNLDELYMARRREICDAQQRAIDNGETDSEGQPYSPLADPEPDEDRASVTVKFRGLSPEALGDFDLVMAYCLETKASEGLVAIRAKRAEVRAAQRALVEAAYASVLGLGEGEADIDCIEDYGLLSIMATLARWWHAIPSAQKKRCGVLPQSILPAPSSTAASAPSECREN